ncbi:MAG: OmpA family protein [Salinivirgaceae bacterium]|jgi:chemotaxis protein MotB|nr:OmpA family protein [Salinivirgaceae bacterium]
MKKVTQTFIILSFFVGMALTSCVSTEKFVASEAQVDKLQNENANVIDQLKICNAELKKLTDENSALLGENSSTKNSLKNLSDASSLTIAEQARLLNDLQNMIQTQKDLMAKLKNSISDALMNYKDDELSVYIKNGNVYISLEEKLLFKSGSDVVDPKGKEALKTLSKVLKDTKKITVLVEGHTDNVPITTKIFKDNWDLSTARATSIVRILTTDYGYSSSLITASGRGQYHPVSSNESASGRAANRRTEIILSPDLKELYALFDM